MVVRMSTAEQAQAYVASKVTCEMVDDGGVRSWQVVDRLVDGGSRLVLPFDNEVDAMRVRNERREQHQMGNVVI